MLAAERYDGAEPVNLGTGAEISIRELAETIAELTGFDGEIVWDASMPNGQPRRALDASRARELFGFTARHRRFATGSRGRSPGTASRRPCMRSADALLERAARGAAAVRRSAALAALQLVSLAALARSGDWTYSAGDAALGAALVSAELVLLYAIGVRDRRPALRARSPALVWIARAARAGCATGSSAAARPSTSTIVYREQFLPSAFGLRGRRRPSRRAACCSPRAWLALAPPRARSPATPAPEQRREPPPEPRRSSIRSSGRRSPRPCSRSRSRAARGRRSRAPAAALVGLAALALFRYVPGHPPGLAHDRRKPRPVPRVLLEPPLARVPAARRPRRPRDPASRPAAAFFGWLLADAILFPLGRR